MLFEKYVSCEEGFGNLYDEKGTCVGFQFQMRLPYYRSVRLSLIDDITVIVDGRTFPRDSITVTLSEGTFSLDEMLTMADHYWEFGEIGVVTVHCRKDYERMIIPEYNRVDVGIDLRIAYADFRISTGKMLRRTVNHG